MKQINNGDICTVDFQKAIKAAVYSFVAFNTVNVINLHYLH